MIPILDTHLHLIYPERFSYPWISGSETLNRAWNMNDYWMEAESLGIECALHMEADVVDQDRTGETSFVLGLPHIGGAIAACRPESIGFAAELEKLLDTPGVLGLRRILHQAPDDLSQSDAFVQNIRRLSNTRLTFDLCVRHDQLSIARNLAASAEDVTFVLDHCGAPDVCGVGLDPWREHIVALAKLPNINAKISGIPAYSGAGWTLETIRPYIEHVIESFGWDRVVWGSDHPVVTLTSSLSHWVGATRDLIKGASASEQARLLNGNARRIYGL